MASLAEAVAVELAAARAAVARWDRAQLAAHRGSPEYRAAFAEAKRTGRALEAAKRKYYESLKPPA